MAIPGSPFVLPQRQPCMFQRIMDQILQGMDSVTCYLDDILVTGSSEVAPSKTQGSSLLHFVLRKITQIITLLITKQTCWYWSFH